MPVDVEGVAGYGAAAERASIDPLDDFAEPEEVVGEEGAVAQEPMAPPDGLDMD